MRVKLWGTRGSLATAGPETSCYGGDTSCVEVLGDDGTLLVLDAGTGIRRLGAAMPDGLRRVDILLTHLHLDHCQGLGFFRPLDDPAFAIHIWGPATPRATLKSRLTRYLSPPLFPIHLHELPSTIVLHDITAAAFEIGEFKITSDLICHPGLTIGFRITGHGKTLAYLPDHEPALGDRRFPSTPEWTSGYALAADTDLLLHDAQFNNREYASRIGWGHSSMEQAILFAQLARTKQLVLFHHDPAHADAELERLADDAIASIRPDFAVTLAREGQTFQLDG